MTVLLAREPLHFATQALDLADQLSVLASEPVDDADHVREEIDQIRIAGNTIHAAAWRITLRLLQQRLDGIQRRLIAVGHPDSVDADGGRP